MCSPCVGEVCYRLLETLRQYGQEQLAASEGSEPVRDRHAVYYLALAEVPYVHRLGGVATLRRRQAEQDNLRAAVRRLVERGDIERALRLAAALFEFWRRGFLAEGQELLTELLSVAPSGTSPPVRAQALAVAGILAKYRGDLGAARALLEAGLALQRQSGSNGQAAFALGQLGQVAREQGDQDGAQAFLTESLAIYREQGDAGGIATQLDRLGTVAHARGDVGAARRLYTESEAMFRDLELLGFLAWSLHHQGCLALDQGDLDAARSLLRQALRLFHAQGCGPQSAGTLAALASVAAAGGDCRRALRLGAAATALAEAMGYRLPNMERSALERWLPPGRQALGSAALPIAAEGRALSLDEAVAEALREGDGNPGQCEDPATGAPAISTATGCRLGGERCQRDRNEACVKRELSKSQSGSLRFHADMDAQRAPSRPGGRGPASFPGWSRRSRAVRWPGVSTCA